MVCDIRRGIGEVGKAVFEKTLRKAGDDVHEDIAHTIVELVQTAAVCFAWIESILAVDKFKLYEVSLNAPNFQRNISHKCGRRHFLHD